jgi:hypothetical protein
LEGRGVSRDNAAVGCGTLFGMKRRIGGWKEKGAIGSYFEISGEEFF